MKYNLLILLCYLIFIVPIFAQEKTIDQRYSFIKYDKNVLHYDSTSPYMRNFFHKWKTVNENESGNINIIHIGGSHVQAGTFTNRVRENLIQQQPCIADRGLIFPYSAAAHCNNPPDYFVHCKEKVLLTRCVAAEPSKPLGLCGIAITTHDSTAYIQIGRQSYERNYDVNQVIVIGESDDDIVPLLNVSGRKIVPSYIDLPTRRYVFNLSEETDSIEIVIPCENGQSFVLQGVYLGNHRSGLSYHAVGVNGASTADYLKCVHFCNDLRLLHPDMVIFGIGINDAYGHNFDTVAFRKRYEKIIDSVRSVNPDCAFIFITNNDSYRRAGRRKRVPNPNGMLVRDVCYRLASATGGAVWDQFEVMGGYKSIDQWRKAHIAKNDRVHFTRDGYIIMGDLLSQALLNARNTAWEKEHGNHETILQDASSKSKASSSNKSSIKPAPPKETNHEFDNYISL